MRLNLRNGKTPGITQPSAELQEAVIRKAYNKAGLDFGDSDYVECHGTGTPVGDPIEVDALGRCFKSSTRNGPLLIGSVRLHQTLHSLFSFLLLFVYIANSRFNLSRSQALVTARRLVV